MRFQVVTPPTLVERIAIGRGVRDLRRLRIVHGPGRWRKLKGVALIRFRDGKLCWAELHWYEADGLGRREMKIKRLLEEHE